MWSSRQLLKKRKGFTLMELICALCIGSILLGICFSLLTFSGRSNAFVDQTDELLYNGNFVIEYIKNEIQSADTIIASEKVKDLDNLYRVNIGLVAMEYQPNHSEKDKYVYFTYYIENANLYRLARRFEMEVPINGVVFSKSNELCSNIESFGDSSIDWDNKILNLHLSIGDSSISNSFKSTILLNCPLDY